MRILKILITYSIFKKKLLADISGNAEDMPPHVSAVLCLMIEIARLDGKIDENEIDEIKNFYLDLYPNGNFSQLPDFSKWVLSFGMILGRLELFAILVLFLPSFWRN